MKFGKTLKIEANLRWNTRWADYYVCYKQLKQLISTLTLPVDEINKIIRLLPTGTPSSGSPPLLAKTVTSDENPREFYFNQAVMEEYRKVQNFLRNQIQSAKRKLEDVDQSRPRSPSPRRKRLSSGEQQETADVSLPKRAEETETSATQTPVTDQSTPTPTPSDSVLEAQPLPGFDSATVKLIQRLDRLSKFAKINHEAFEKIIKKYNKKILPLCGKSHDEVFSLHSHMETLEGYVRTIQEMHAHVTQNCQDLLVEEEDNGESSLEEISWEDDIPVVTELALDSIRPDCTARFWLVLGEDAMGQPIKVPVIVAKGKFQGPVLGATSALHGNELNGIPLLHQLLRYIDTEILAGTFVAVPVLNPPGFFRKQRSFHDGQDLNRLFPGNPSGNCGQQYVHMVMEKLVSTFDYHVDLHTASFGRLNSFYVRADMNHPVSHKMAMVQCCQIIVHNTATDGSLRWAAMERNIPSITLEIGNPQTIHPAYQRAGFTGMKNLLFALQMVPRDEGELGRAEEQVLGPVTLCTRSKWFYSSVGGMLKVHPTVNQWISKGEVYAQVRNMFGDVVATFRAPTDGIVVGKSSNPVCNVGDRLIHLGVVGTYFAKASHDGHT